MGKSRVRREKLQIQEMEEEIKETLKPPKKKKVKDGPCCSKCGKPVEFLWGNIYLCVDKKCNGVTKI